MQLVTNAGRVRIQKWCSSWGQNDFFSHFHSITTNGATISQRERLFSRFSFSVTHIKSKCFPVLNKNVSAILDGSITFDPPQSSCSPSVLGGWSNTIVSAAPTTYWGGRRWGEGWEGRGGGGLRQWKQTLVASSALLCHEQTTLRFSALIHHSISSLSLPMCAHKQSNASVHHVQTSCVNTIISLNLSPLWSTIRMQYHHHSDLAHYISSTNTTTQTFCRSKWHHIPS